MKNGEHAQFTGHLVYISRCRKQIQSVPPPTHQKYVYASLTRVGWDVGSESDGKHPHVEQEPPYSGANWTTSP